VQPKLALSPKLAAARNAVRATLSCPADGTACRGTIRASAKASGKRVALGSASFALASGTTRALTVRLSPRGRAALTRAGKLRATVVVKGKASASARASTTTKTVVLRAR
jgi:hypothetical protein